MKYYVIYKITNKINNKKYIGCHMTENINDGYMGSGKLIKLSIEKYGIDNFEKEIMYYCDDENHMLKTEKEIVNEDVVKSKEYYNLTLGGGSGWYYINSNLDKYKQMNKVVVKDDNNIFKVSKYDERYLSGVFTSVNCGYVIVKDDNNNFYRVSINDERYLSGELKGITKGLILSKDKNGKIFMIDKDDERYINGELKPIFSGMKHKNETKIKIGKANSEYQKGCGNSQYGTCWIYNEKLKENKKIKKFEIKNWLNDGWLKGRKMNY